MNSAHQLETQIADALRTIRRAWPRHDNPPPPAQRRRPPGPRTPGGPGATLRASIWHDLHYWTRALNNDGIWPLPAEGVTSDIPAITAHLAAGARAISGWEYAPTMADDLSRDAHELDTLTRPPEPAIRLGPCPREVVTTDDRREPCGAIVRAHIDKPSDVRCPGCGHTDTIEGWQRLIVEETPLATADELARRLTRVGIRTTPDGIRMRVKRGVIPGPIDTDEQGRNLWHAEAVVGALLRREQRAS